MVIMKKHGSNTQNISNRSFGSTPNLSLGVISSWAKDGSKIAPAFDISTSTYNDRFTYSLLAAIVNGGSDIKISYMACGKL